jgi:RND family efflux transporter MFP subunit
MPRKIRKYLFLLFAAAGVPSALASDLMSFEVRSGEISRERLFDGVIEAIKHTTLSAQTQGRIIEINFDINDFVEKDAVLIKISDHEQSASVEQAIASISDIRAQLSLANTNFQRFKTLLASNTISQSEYDDARTALQRARANLKNAEAARDQALKQVDYTVVRAPYSGIVTARMVELGEAVSPGTPLMSGFSLAQMRVRTEVPNRFAQQIDTDKGVDIVLDTRPATRIHSSKVTVFPFANPKSNSVTVRVELPQGSSDVYPGMLTKVAFVTEQDTRILIPRSAIFNRSEVTGVYVLEGENISLRRLSIGQAYPGKNGETMLEVLSGLQVGERVAADPVAAVRQLKSRQLEAGKSADSNNHE